MSDIPPNASSDTPSAAPAPVAPSAAVVAYAAPRPSRHERADRSGYWIAWVVIVLSSAVMIKRAIDYAATRAGPATPPRPLVGVRPSVNPNRRTPVPVLPSSPTTLPSTRPRISRPRTPVRPRPAPATQPFAGVPNRPSIVPPTPIPPTPVPPIVRPPTPVPSTPSAP